MRIIDPDEDDPIKVKSHGHNKLPVKPRPSGFWKPKKAAKIEKTFKVKIKNKAAYLKKKVTVGEHDHHQRFFRPKYKHHPKMDIEELHDGETYCFYDYGAGGSLLRVIEGYRLKRAWDNYSRAHTNPPPMKIRGRNRRENPYNNAPEPFKSNWVDVVLPNGMLLTVQPRSSTPSYFKNGQSPKR